MAWNPLHDTLTYLLGANGGSGFGSSTTAEEVVKNWDGQGKVAIVTGEKLLSIVTLQPCGGDASWTPRNDALQLRHLP